MKLFTDEGFAFHTQVVMFEYLEYLIKNPPLELIIWGRNFGEETIILEKEENENSDYFAVINTITHCIYIYISGLIIFIVTKADFQSTILITWIVSTGLMYLMFVSIGKLEKFKKENEYKSTGCYGK